jgi:general secretion pathway protein I
MTRTETGFTLLEVLVAFVIAALALGALYEGTLTGIRSVRDAARYEQALSRADSHMAALMVSGSAHSGTQSGDDGGGFRWETEETPVGEHAEPAQAGGTMPVLFELKVTMSWQMDGGDRRITRHSERLASVSQRAP